MASLNDLKALAISLPPSERVMSGEVGDVLSALIAFGEYGDDIVKAAESGKIADFFHDKAVASAVEAGTEEPRKGAVPVTTPAPVSAAPHSGKLEADVASLKADFASLIAALKGDKDITPSTAVTPVDTSVTPVDTPDDTPVTPVTPVDTSVTPATPVDTTVTSDDVSTPA